MKVNLILNTLVQQTNLTPMEMLTLITRVRMLLGGDKEDESLHKEFGEVVTETNILSMMSQVFSLSDQDHLDGGIDKHGDSLVRYMKLEMMWSLINIGSGPGHVVEIVFDEQYDMVSYFNRVL